MIGIVRSFNRLSETPQTAEGPARTLRLMRWHCALAGVILFVAGVALAGSLYSEFDRTGVDWSLRFERTSKLYDAGIQVRLLLALGLGMASLVQFSAVRRLRRSQRGGMGIVWLAVLFLIASGALSWWLWNSELDIPGAPVSLVRNGLRAVALVLAVQAALAVLYAIRLSSRPVRAALAAGDAPPDSPVRRLRTAGVALWVAVVAGLGITLGVATDWLVEIPVPAPEPGELLYATTFEADTDLAEWDLYPGRDAAAIVTVTDLVFEDTVPDGESLSGQVLQVIHGAPYPGEVVWSSLNRKFNDFDLRVTAQQVAGPVDQNQYGVIFRYRDDENFYIFRVTSDQYYSVARVKDGIEEKISDWGVSDAIRAAANEIRIVARGATFQFYVNGQLMPLCLRGENRTSMWSEPGVCFTSDLQTEYRDDGYKQGRIALAVGTFDGSAVTVAFDDLVIVGPEPADSEEG